VARQIAERRQHHDEEQGAHQQAHEPLSATILSWEFHLQTTLAGLRNANLFLREDARAGLAYDARLLFRRSPKHQNDRHGKGCKGKKTSIDGNLAHSGSPKARMALWPNSPPSKWMRG